MNPAATYTLDGDNSQFPTYYDQHAWNTQYAVSMISNPMMVCSLCKGCVRAKQMGPHAEWHYKLVPGPASVPSTTYMQDLMKLKTENDKKLTAMLDLVENTVKEINILKQSIAPYGKV